jgi:hypothetical protein
LPIFRRIEKSIKLYQLTLFITVCVYRTYELNVRFLIGDYLVQHLNTKVTLIATAILGLTLTHAALAEPASPERLNEVTPRGMHIMPFDLKQTQHLFNKTETGGVQQVIVKDLGNRKQIELIR